MSRIPRFLPMLAVAVGGVLAVNAVSGARSLPDLLTGAKAWAEEVAANPKADAEAKAKADKEAKALAAKNPLPPNASLLPSAQPAPQVCAPTAAELARQAGLSPAELQVLQSLGVRRNQLDQRETDMDVQLALMAAAEAKLDAKLKTLASLKGEITGLLGQADSAKTAELDRLVKVFETMKPKDAAARMTIISDDVRLHIGAKMKDRALSAIIAQMAPKDAKDFTEKLANRLAAAEAAKQALAQAQPAPPPPAAQAAAAPKAAPKPAPPRQAQARPRPRPAAAPAKPQAVAQGARRSGVCTAPTVKPAAPPASPAAPVVTPPATKAG